MEAFGAICGYGGGYDKRAGCSAGIEGWRRCHGGMALLILLAVMQRGRAVSAAGD